MENEAVKGHKVLLVEAINAAREAGDINTYSLLNGSLLSINILEKEIKRLKEKVVNLEDYIADEEANDY